MNTPRSVVLYILVTAFAATLSAQQNSPNLPDPPVPRLSPGSEHKPTTASPQTASPQVIPLTVPTKTSLQVALEKEVRVRKVGQSVSARLVDPVYAFDQLVVPAGSEIRGEVTKIDPISGGRRTLAGLDADFTPAHKVEVTFTDPALPDGSICRCMPA